MTTEASLLVGYFGVFAAWALYVYIKRERWLWPALILLAATAGAVALGLIK